MSCRGSFHDFYAGTASVSGSVGGVSPRTGGALKISRSLSQSVAESWTSDSSSSSDNGEGKLTDLLLKGSMP